MIDIYKEAIILGDVDQMEKHKAIIKGTENRKIYYFGYTSCWHSNDRSILGKLELIKEKTLWEGDIDTPLLEEGEILRIEDLGREVVITRRDRSTSGAYVYKTDYEFELVEDEKTSASKRAAEAEEEKYLEAVAELEVKRREALEKMIEPVKEKKSIWKRMFS